MENQAGWGERLARSSLKTRCRADGRTSKGLATQARSLAPMLGDHADLREATAYLHDIGYAPDLAKTGFHPLDRARYLRDVEHADPRLCSLVGQ
jgi:hypothetical protein